MAHFAELSNDNEVIRVIVIANDCMMDNDGNESEAVGVAFIERTVGPGRWLQTSYNRRFRGNYAGIGMVYDTELDVFIERQPYPSWTLDADWQWVAPVPKPTEEGYWYEWDEQGQAWIPHKIEEPPAS